MRTHGLEGLIAKRRGSLYEPGQRSGAWRKMRVNQGQEFVIGGYTPSGRSFDALIFGYYDSGKLMYAARTRNGFTPRVRRDIFAQLQSYRPRCARLRTYQRRALGAGAKGSLPPRWLNAGGFDRCSLGSSSSSSGPPTIT